MSERDDCGGCARLERWADLGGRWRDIIEAADPVEVALVLHKPCSSPVCCAVHSDVYACPACGVHGAFAADDSPGGTWRCDACSASGGPLDLIVWAATGGPPPLTRGTYDRVRARGIQVIADLLDLDAERDPEDLVTDGAP